MAEPLTPEQRWALLKQAAAPEAPVAWLLEKLGQGAGNLRQAVTDPRAFHERALTNVVEQLQRDPTEFAMNFTGGGLGGVIKPKGGNWLAGQVERAVAPLRQTMHAGTDPAAVLREVENAQALANLQPRGLEMLDQAKAEAAKMVSVNKWLEGKLTKYIKNEMATPEDPLRLAADKWAQVSRPQALAENAARLEKAQADMARAQAERGVTPEMLTSSRARILELEKERDYLNARTGLHMNIDREFGEPQYRALQGYREAFGYPREATAASPQGKSWEDLADFYMQRSDAGDIVKEGHFLREADARRIYNENPWLFKVPPETHVYSLNRGMSERETGFKHMVDELNNALNPESGLPKELRITAKDLEKKSVADIADLVDRINAHRAVQKAEANKLAAQKSIEVYKEYPESEKGLRWVEMKQIDYNQLPKEQRLEMIERLRKEASEKNLSPEDYIEQYPRKELETALKYEGDVMKHCVGGYCPDVIEGRSRIFSLRDSSGKPYATVEVKPAEQNFQTFWDSLSDTQRAELEPVISQQTAEMISQVQQRPEIAQYGTQAVENMAWKMGVENLPQFKQYMSQPRLYIEQIKGPGNRKPADEVMPYVQDFVRSQPWSRVEDLHHTDLLKFRNEYVSPSQLEYKTDDGWRNLQEFARERFPDNPTQQNNFMRGAESMSDELLRPTIQGLSHGGAVGMAAGGVVEFDPDKIDRIAAEFWDEQSADQPPAAPAQGRPVAPTRPEELRLRDEDLNLRLVRGQKGYNLRAETDAAGVRPFVDVDPWRRLIAQYGVQYEHPLPGGAASGEFVFDPVNNARVLSGAYRQQLGKDSEVSARGAYVSGSEKPSYNLGLQYKRRFDDGGKVEAPSRWELFKQTAAPEAPAAWLLEKLGQGASNIKQAITNPREFNTRAIANLKQQYEEDPIGFAMNWTGGGLGGVIKPSGIGKRAAEAALKTDKTARDLAVIEAANASKQGFLNESAVSERVYHATDKDFEKFSPYLLGEKRKAGTDKLGFWFGETPGSTEFYITNPKQGAEFVEGANIIPAYLQMKKPYRMNAEEFYELSKKNTKAGETLKKTLQEAGYDGVIAETGSGNAYAVFEPTQVKSALGMQGHYDVKNAEITKAKGGRVGFSAGGSVTAYDEGKIQGLADALREEMYA